MTIDLEIRIGEAELRHFAERIFRKRGLSAKDAFTMADSLIFANLRGIDSHGIARLPFYLRRLEDGGNKTEPEIKIVKETRASAVIDGDDGMGQVVSVFAADVAVRKASEVGTSFVGVRRSAHSGAISYYAMHIAKAGMIGITISNTTPVMAAWGGCGSVIGNNPLSIAVPYENRGPLVLDMAASRVAGGKVRLAARNGKRIPTGWIVNAKGMETTDPHDLTSGGALLPFGEHKGFALAIMLEVLGGVLAGSGMLGQIPFFVEDTRSSLDIGHAFIAIDIASLMDPDQFQRRLHWMVQTLKGSRPAEGSPGIFMPGELELQIEEERKAQGIPISLEVYRDLEGLSSRYHEPLPTAGAERSPSLR